MAENTNPPSAAELEERARMLDARERDLRAAANAIEDRVRELDDEKLDAAIGEIADRDDDDGAPRKHPWSGRCLCFQDAAGDLRLNPECPIHGRHFKREKGSGALLLDERGRVPRIILPRGAA